MNERIKKIRKELELTQQEFASRIGTSQNVLANYEIGRRNPSASVINNICKTFSVNENWLRTGEGEPFIPINKEQQLTDWAESVFNQENGDFKRRFVTMLMNLNENEWKLIEAKAKELVGDSNANTLYGESATELISNQMTVKEAETAYIKSISEHARKKVLSPSNITGENGKRKSDAV